MVGEPVDSATAMRPDPQGKPGDTLYRRRMLNALSSIYDTIYDLNYTKDTAVEIYNSEGNIELVGSFGEVHPVMEGAEAAVEYLIHPDDVDAYLSVYLPENVSSWFSDESVGSHVVEVRMRGRDDVYRWYQTGLIRMDDPSGDMTFLAVSRDVDEFISTKKALDEYRIREAGQRAFSSMIDNIPVGIALFTFVGHRMVDTYCNRRFYDIFGIAEGDLETLETVRLAFVREHPDLMRGMDGMRITAESGALTKVVPALRIDGTPFQLRLDLLVEYESADRWRCYTVAADVTEQMHRERLFNRQADLYKILLADRKDLMFEYDIDVDVMRLFNATDLSRGVFDVTTTFLDYVSSGHIIHPDETDAFIAWLTHVSISEKLESVEFQADLRGDEYRWWRAEYKVMADEWGRADRVIGLIRQTDDEHRLKMQLEDEMRQNADLEHRAYLDAVTGLFNRRALTERVDAYLSEGSRMASFLMLDLDDFKTVNDALGHQTGDKLLHDFGVALQETVRETDILGRLGGDEFVVFLVGVNRYSVAVSKAEVVIGRITELRRTLGLDADAGVSIGIAMCPADGEDFLSLYAAADNALYAAKEAGKNRYSFA